MGISRWRDIRNTNCWINLGRENPIVTFPFSAASLRNIFESFFPFPFFFFCFLISLVNSRKSSFDRQREFISHARVVVVVVVASNFALRFIDSLFNPNCNLFLLTGFSRECATVLEVKLRIAKWKHVLNGNV